MVIKEGTKGGINIRTHTNESTDFYPDKPTVNTPTPVSTGVEVSWSRVSGADGYHVYRRESGGSWEKILTVCVDFIFSFIDPTVEAGKTYEYTVRAYNASALSDYEKKGKSITIQSGILATPSISDVSIVSGGVEISWGTVTGAELYRIFFKKQGVNGWRRLADTVSTSYTWTGAKPGTTYFFTVRCISSDGKIYTSGYDADGKAITYTGR